VRRPLYIKLQGNFAVSFNWFFARIRALFQYRQMRIQAACFRSIKDIKKWSPQLRTSRRTDQPCNGGPRLEGTLRRLAVEYRNTSEAPSTAFGPIVDSMSPIPSDIKVTHFAV
jgi:hypothetical protein